MWRSKLPLDLHKNRIEGTITRLRENEHTKVFFYICLTLFLDIVQVLQIDFLRGYELDLLIDVGLALLAGFLIGAENIGNNNKRKYH